LAAAIFDKEAQLVEKLIQLPAAPNRES